MPAAAESNRVPFTKTRIQALAAPAAGRVYYYDATTPGLALCVTAADSRTFYVYRKVRGRPVRIKIGPVDEITVENARKKALQLIGDIASGKDPQAERIAKRGEMTFDELFRFYLDTYSKPHKKTWAEDERQYKCYLASWKNRKYTTISKADVQALHTRIGKKSGRYAANRLRSLVHSMFAKAIADLGYEKPNPAHGVKKFKEQSRERFLHADELPKFFAALDQEPNQTIRDYFTILLLVGQRRTNTLEMIWADVNLDRAEWRIPMTKSGEATTAHLPAAAIAILKRRQENTKSVWVFPGHVKGEHLKDPTKNWKAVCKRAGLDNLRPHDLRRTLGSWQAATGASLPVIGKSLGHRSQSATAIYARLDLDPVRAAVDTAATAMLKAGRPKT